MERLPLSGKTVLKITVSLVMLFLILRLVNFAALAHTLSTLSVGSICLLTAGYLGGQFLSALKWWIIVREGGIEVSFSSALKAYFIGMFTNVLGVGTLGGDMTRALLLTRGLTSKGPALASVIADRLHGLSVLAGMGVISIFLFGPHTLDPTYAYLLMAFGGAIVIGWFIGPWFLPKIVSKHHLLSQRVARMLRVFPKRPQAIILISVISCIFHLSQIALHKLMGYSLGIDIPWSYLLVACPFISIVSSLPISWQGLGVRENAYKTFFTPAGILTPEQAVAFGAIWFFSMTISGCIGGTIAVLTGDMSLSGRIRNLPPEALKEIEGDEAEGAGSC